MTLHCSPRYEADVSPHYRAETPGEARERGRSRVGHAVHAVGSRRRARTACPTRRAEAERAAARATLLLGEHLLATSLAELARGESKLVPASQCPPQPKPRPRR